MKGFSLFFLLALVFSLSVAGQEVIVLTDEEKITISSEVELFNDPDNTLSIEEIQSVPFEKNKHKTVNIGYNNTIDWFKLSVYNPGNNDVDRTVQINKFLIDKVTFYYNENGTWNSISTGAHLSGSDRSLNTFSTGFPVTFTAQDTLTFYIRMVSSYSRQFNIAIVKEEVLIKNDIREGSILGFFTGGLLIITIFNFFIGLRVKDTVYFHYILANIATGITVLAIRGYFSY
ncbi:MAG: hypothetical protein MI866_09305, partial [Bacteroidales bacterium]|nr:hypothetical protein [Bacteroidales bacterium]